MKYPSSQWQSICMCRLHQSVADLSVRSPHRILGNTHTGTAIIAGDWWTGEEGHTPCTAIITVAKKSQLGFLISFQLPMGFQNFIKILIEFTSFKIYITYIYIVLFCLLIKFASYVTMI